MLPTFIWQLLNKSMPCVAIVTAAPQITQTVFQRLQLFAWSIYEPARMPKLEAHVIVACVNVFHLGIVSALLIYMGDPLSSNFAILIL
jgi:hypothetical protein